MLSAVAAYWNAAWISKSNPTIDGNKGGSLQTTSVLACTKVPGKLPTICLAKEDVTRTVGYHRHGANRHWRCYHNWRIVLRTSPRCHKRAIQYTTPQAEIDSLWGIPYHENHAVNGWIAMQMLRPG
jgi:hypothetical protein